MQSGQQYLMPDGSDLPPVPPGMMPPPQYFYQRPQYAAGHPSFYDQTANFGGMPQGGYMNYMPMYYPPMYAPQGPMPPMMPFMPHPAMCPVPAVVPDPAQCHYHNKPSAQMVANSSSSSSSRPLGSSTPIYEDRDSGDFGVNRYRESDAIDLSNISPTSSDGHHGYQQFRPERRRQSNIGVSSTTHYKTRMCVVVERKGKCDLGSNCRFAHTQEEMKTAQMALNEFRAKQNPKYKTRLCKNFFPGANGNCPYENRCEFLHKGDKGYEREFQKAVRTPPSDAYSPQPQLKPVESRRLSLCGPSAFQPNSDEESSSIAERVYRRESAMTQSVQALNKLSLDDEKKVAPPPGFGVTRQSRPVIPFGRRLAGAPTSLRRSASVENFHREPSRHR